MSRPSSLESTAPAKFEITSQIADARRGRLTVGETTLETPNLLPVVNFYAGGTSNSLFGGGVHRTIKEFMTASDAIGGSDQFQKYFDCVMTSAGSLTDYNINRERYEDYISTPVKQRPEFSDFDGALFIDSGGFKFLNGGELDGSNFEVEIDQRKIYEIQEWMGADILVNLDRPITPDDGYEERIEKARATAANIDEFLQLSEGTTKARYLTLHGYNYSMLDTFLQQVDERVGIDRVRTAFDGIALGSLVPLKDNRGALIDAVQQCRSVLADWGFADLPLHVLGISSTAIPLLATIGVDSFDSSSYLHSAINGKYSTSLAETINITNADFTECDCPVCTTPELVNRMRGGAEYQKDILGPVAMHNLIVQKRALSELRTIIDQGEKEELIEYLEDTLGYDKSLRTFVHRVVNESLGGYF